MEQPVVITTIVIAFVLIIFLVVLLVRQNKAGFATDKIPGASDGAGKGMGMGIGIALGMGVGIAIGVAMDNITIGIAIGSGVGVSLGVALGSGFKKNEGDRHFLNKKERPYHKTQNAKMPLLVGLITAMLGMLMLGLIFFMRKN